VESLQEMSITVLLSDFKFGENRSSESHTLLKVVSEFVSLLSTFIDGCG